jgi:hypothetical protein
LDDSGGTPREIPVNSINGVGLDYPEADVTAFQDAIRGVLPDTPDCTITVAGPFDNTAAVALAGTGAAPTLSGSHTILSGINGVNTPLGLCICIGIRGYWATGDPVFGLVSPSATVGFLCLSYIVDPGAGTYSATFKVYPGSTAPSWGTAILT